MITVEKYSHEKKTNWDNFVENSKNGTFMLKRDYMDYHADRFIDFSLMFFSENKLIALMPASLHNSEVVSHGGLSYGGIIVNSKMTMQKMLHIFNALKNFLTLSGVHTLTYKTIPSLYHSYPSEEDLYALFTVNAKLTRRDVSTVIFLPEKLKYSTLRKRCIKKAKEEGLSITQSEDFNTFVDILNEVLLKQHNTKAVHTAEELIYLTNNFPDNIKLFVALDKSKIVSGILIFETPHVAHTQYIVNSEEGRNIGALDLLIDYLITEYAKNKKYFSFGISTENNGQYLNEGLIAQKEGFGGRAICHDFYEWVINNS